MNSIPQAPSTAQESSRRSVVRVQPASAPTPTTMPCISGEKHHGSGDGWTCRQLPSVPWTSPGKFQACWRKRLLLFCLLWILPRKRHATRKAGFPGQLQATAMLSCTAVGYGFPAPFSKSCELCVGNAAPVVGNVWRWAELPEASRELAGVTASTRESHPFKTGASTQEAGSAHPFYCLFSGNSWSVSCQSLISGNQSNNLTAVWGLDGPGTWGYHFALTFLGLLSTALAWFPSPVTRHTHPVRESCPWPRSSGASAAGSGSPVTKMQPEPARPTPSSN